MILIRTPQVLSGIQYLKTKTNCLVKTHEIGSEMLCGNAISPHDNSLCGSEWWCFHHKFVFVFLITYFQDYLERSWGVLALSPALLSAGTTIDSETQILNISHSPMPQCHCSTIYCSNMTNATHATKIIWHDGAYPRLQVSLLWIKNMGTSNRDRRPVAAMCCLSSQSPVSSLYQRKLGKGIQWQWGNNLKKRKMR